MHQISNFYTQVCTQKVKINYVLCLQYYGIRNFWYTKHNNLLSWDPIGRENFHLLIALADLERTVFLIERYFGVQRRDSDREKLRTRLPFSENLDITFLYKI